MPPNVSYSDIRAEDLRRAARNRLSFWASSLITAAFVILAGVAIFMGWLSILDSWIPPQFWPAIQFLLALTPAAIWLASFSIIERNGNGVRRAAFLLWLVTGALYFVTVNPLLTHIFQINEWLYVSWWSEWLGRLLIIAPLEMFLIYLVMRYGVYPTSAFQRLVDGPLYGVAAGLGIATAINLLTALSPGFTDLGQGVLQICELALGYAALGALLGYFMGQARFRRTNTFYLAAGLLLSVILHAAFFFALNFVRAQNLFLQSLDALIFAGVFAILVFMITYWLLHRSQRAFMHMAALVEIQEEANKPKSLLADVMHMVETDQLEVRSSPPPPPTRSGNDHDNEDELESLKRSWETLISEQEANRG